MSASPVHRVDFIEFPREYLEFFRLFNEGDFFEAHEVLEDLWVLEVPPLKDYYKGLIQAAVALCHWERGNHSGARKLTRSALAYLDPYPAEFERFALGAFRDTIRALTGPLFTSPAPPPPQRSAIPELVLNDLSA